MSRLIGSDFLLFLLYCDNQAPIRGAIRLTKMMFIFDKEIAPLLTKKGITYDNPPIFQAYHYGPFSKDVYEQIELFKEIKFIKVSDLKTDESLLEVDDWEEDSLESEDYNEEGFSVQKDGHYYKYEIISKGKSYVIDKILPMLSEDQIGLLDRFKKKINSMSAQQILHYVYANYPKYTTKSLIKEDVLDE